MSEDKPIYNHCMDVIAELKREIEEKDKQIAEYEAVIKAVKLDSAAIHELSDRQGEQIVSQGNDIEHLRKTMYALEDNVMGKDNQLTALTSERDSQDLEWFQIIESFMGFHPISQTDALTQGIAKVKKWKQQISALKDGNKLLPSISEKGENTMNVPEFTEWIKAVADSQDIAGEDALKLVSIIEQYRQVLRDVVAELPPKSFARRSVSRAYDMEVHADQ